MQIRMPLACLLILSYTFAFYKSKQRLHTATATVFQRMCIFGLIHLLSAVVTEYTVNNRDSVSPAFNYVWHLVFLISVTGVCTMLPYYLLLYVERHTGRSQMPQKRALLAVFCIGVFLELILPIWYVDTPHGSYSLGPKAFALYDVVGYSMITLVVTLVRYKRSLNPSTMHMLLATVAIFSVVSAIQIVFPYMLLTSLAITLILLGLMSNTEDTHIYIPNEKNGLCNRRGCRVLLQELLLRTPFRIAIYVFLGDEKSVLRHMCYLKEQFAQYHMICGTINDKTLIAIPSFFHLKASVQLETLPEPDALVDGEKYASSLFSFDQSYTVEQIFSILNDFCARFEEDINQRDELTGLPRRTAFTRQVEYLVNMGKGFTFLMIDIDDFKSVNDCFGHGVGDEAIRYVAKVFSQTLRSSDLLCRMGGDEFAIVLFGVTTCNDVRITVERIHSQLLQCSPLPNGQGITLSIGAKIRMETDSPTFQELYEQADAAMYRAKSGGRGGLCFAEEA